MKNSIFLSLLIALTAICLSCSNDNVTDLSGTSSYFSDGNLRYTTNDDGISVTISGYNSMSLRQINIPSKVTNTGKRYTITSIGNRAFCQTGLVSITIPESVTSIGDSAFYKCSVLTSITLPKGVTSIGNYAFAYAGLTSITLPKGLSSVGDSVFYSCTKLQEIYDRNSIPPSVGVDGLFGIDKSTCILYVPIGSKEAYATADQWKNFENIEESKMEPVLQFTVDNLKYITNIAGTFASVCGYVTEPVGQFAIPSSATYNGKSYAVAAVGDSAFKYCRKITSITISEGVTSIGVAAFYGCNELTSITIPSNVTLVGLSAFADCSGLQELYVRNLVPPAVNSYYSSLSAFSNVNMSTCKLYVPVGSKEAYAAADEWKFFMSIEEMSMTEE